MKLSRLPRSLPYSRWWLRPTVYTLVAILGASGGYTAQIAQGRARIAAQNATTKNELLASYLRLLGQIADAKKLGIDTSEPEKSLTLILTDIHSGNFTSAIATTHAESLLMTSSIATAQGVQQAVLDEAKKFGYLNLSLSNGAGAAVVATFGSTVMSVTADDSGVAILKLLVGTYTLTITKDGYQPLTIVDLTIASLGTLKETVTLVANPIATPTPTTRPTPSATPQPSTTPVPSSSTAHSSYRRTTVDSSRGSFTADIMEFDLGPGKIKVYTDTAADGDCADACPVMAVKSYADRYNGAVAAINGTYFCPADYSSCVGQVGTFFWKIMNPRLGFTINQHNGLGENDPYLTFASNGTATFCSSWSICRLPYAGINHKPAVVTNGSYSVDENTLDDKQRTAKISRGAIGLTGQHLSVVVIQSATIMDLGAVMVSLGVTNAINIDAGGSSGIWYNGSYKRGPGRGVPNALVFIEQ
jgi:exopolysaccharide biosynthesis protein